MPGPHSSSGPHEGRFARHSRRAGFTTASLPAFGTSPAERQGKLLRPLGSGTWPNMEHCRGSFLGALLLLGGTALLCSACSSSYSIPVLKQFTFGGGGSPSSTNAVIPTNTSCEVSGGTTTATGSVAGPATVQLVLTAQNAAGKTIGTSGRISRSVPLGGSWNWTISANTAGFVPARCTIDSDGSVRSTTGPT